MSESTPASGGIEVTFNGEPVRQEAWEVAPPIDLEAIKQRATAEPWFARYQAEQDFRALVAEVERLREVVHASDLAVTRYTQRALVAEGEVERILGLLEDVNDEAGRLRERVRWLEARIATTGIPD